MNNLAAQIIPLKLDKMTHLREPFAFPGSPSHDPHSHPPAFPFCSCAPHSVVGQLLGTKPHKEAASYLRATPDLPGLRHIALHPGLEKTSRGSAPLGHPSFVRYFAPFRGLRERALTFQNQKTKPPKKRVQDSSLFAAEADSFFPVP
jgi:hypothetical protein